MIRLALRVRREDAELVLAELLPFAPNGLEERDIGPGGGGIEYVEYALYGAPGELPALPELRAVVGGALVEVATEEVGDDWAERWREFHEPLVVGRRLVVRPPWTEDVVIDPGQAFGTGGHATTRLCLAALLGLDPGGPLLDLGCGSGVLAVAAAKLGWAPVRAVDFDPLAVAAAEANAEANGVELETARLDLRADPVPEAPVVLANLLRPLLLTLAERLDFTPRVLVASGLLQGEEDEVAAAFAARGLTAAERTREGDWACLVIRPDAGRGCPP